MRRMAKIVEGLAWWRVVRASEMARYVLLGRRLKRSIVGQVFGLVCRL